MFDDDDDMMGGFGMPGGMGGMGGRPGPRRSNSTRSTNAGPSAPSEITKPIKISLEDLYHGTTKHLKVGRKLLDGTTEDKVLEIVVLPGWKSGTKVRFPRAGNEQPTGESQDLVFVIEEKEHPRFTRDGNDLRVKVALPLVDALAGSSPPTKTVEAIDGRKLSVKIPDGVVKPGQKTVVAGAGMPIRKSSDGKKRGDMIVEWDVVFPERLTASQKEGLRKVLG